MAFGGVLLFMGALSVVLFTMLGMLVTGVCLLIAALVFGILYRRDAKRGLEPRRWQKIAGIVCAVLGAGLTALAVVIWLALVIVSHS